MGDLDLGQNARVIWLSVTLAGPGERKAQDFETLMRAILFVMEDLHEAERVTAIIAIDEMPGTLPLDRIEEIYATLTRG